MLELDLLLETRLLLWGIFPRLVGCLFMLASVVGFRYVLVFAGKDGMRPEVNLLERRRKDFPNPLLRWFKYPTLLWFDCSDFMLQFWFVVSFFSSLGIVIGGPYTRYLFILTHFSMLAMDTYSHFPWDCFLFELGFMCWLLPPLPLITDTIAASALPLPVVSFAFRWFVCRLMVGFGKTKFVGHQWSSDMLYIKYFLTNMPMPSWIGWHMRSMPFAFYYFGMVFMFVAEIITPFMFFFPGWPRLIAAIINVKLQIGIQISGNFGFFNLATAIATIPVFDIHASMFDQPIIDGLFNTNTWVNLLVIALQSFSLFVFVFNSWCAGSWFNWPVWCRHPAMAVARFLHRFRFMHSYGVFPPHSLPPNRYNCVFEGSNDGKSWKRYIYKYQCSHEKWKPRIISPFMPRFDFIMYYSAFNTHQQHLQNAMLSGDPYVMSHHTLTNNVCRRLLEGSPTICGVFDQNPFPAKPPKYVRCEVIMFAPTSPEYMHKTGKYWTETRLYTNTAPMSLDSDPDYWKFEVLTPEQFHPDRVVSKDLTLGGMVSYFNQSSGDKTEASRAIIEGYNTADREVTSQHVNLFWNSLIEDKKHRDLVQTWEQSAANSTQTRAMSSESRRLDTKELVETIKQEYSTEQWIALERILGRLSHLFVMQVEKIIYQRKPVSTEHVGCYKKHVDMKNRFGVTLLAHYVISKGRKSYESLMSVLRSAEAIEDLATRLDTLWVEMHSQPRTGWSLLLLFWYEAVYNECRDWITATTLAAHIRDEIKSALHVLPGFLHYVDNYVDLFDHVTKAPFQVTRNGHEVALALKAD